MHGKGEADGWVLPGELDAPGVNHRDGALGDVERPSERTLIDVRIHLGLQRMLVVGIPVSRANALSTRRTKSKCSRSSAVLRLEALGTARADPIVGVRAVTMIFRVLLDAYHKVQHGLAPPAPPRQAPHGSSMVADSSTGGEG